MNRIRRTGKSHNQPEPVATADTSSALESEAEVASDATAQQAQDAVESAALPEESVVLDAMQPDGSIPGTDIEEAAPSTEDTSDGRREATGEAPGDIEHAIPAEMDDQAATTEAELRKTPGKVSGEAVADA